MKLCPVSNSPFFAQCKEIITTLKAQSKSIYMTSQHIAVLASSFISIKNLQNKNKIFEKYRDSYVCILWSNLTVNHATITQIFRKLYNQHLQVLCELTHFEVQRTSFSSFFFNLELKYNKFAQSKYFLLIILEPICSLLGLKDLVRLEKNESQLKKTIKKYVISF